MACSRPFVLVVTLAALLCPGPLLSQLPIDSVLGYWQSGTGKQRRTMQITPHRCAWRVGDEFHAFLARHERGKLLLNFHGITVSWQVGIAEGKLKVRTGRASPRVYERVDPKDVERFEPEPMELRKARRVKKSRLKNIQKALRKRARKDQQERARFASEKQLAAVDGPNTKFLKKTVQEIGWIDVKRFGEKAADDAWTLVIHSGDLPLMRAALIAIEKEAKSKKLNAGQNYGSLFDRVQMDLGFKQRFGTQVSGDGAGGFVVFPLEDVAKVDSFRKDIGMASFAKSLEKQARWTGGKKPVVQTGW